ncbi:MAG: hypothetical protein IT343_05205 [Candidatus Melainabacteria bacterium]|jgi:hypothetical protein|nr:hypothetical protein [Candidatus Melainabacteria bacterium]
MFQFLSTNNVLVQAIISAELLCCVFYLIQWLCADFIVSAKTRANMKELGDLILMSTLLFIIVSCNIPNAPPAVGSVANAATGAVQWAYSETVHVCRTLSQEISGVGKSGPVRHLAIARTNSRVRRHHI